jgi:hypothetical protein
MSDEPGIDSLRGWRGKGSAMDDRDRCRAAGTRLWRGAELLRALKRLYGFFITFCAVMFSVTAAACGQASVTRCAER